MTWTRKKHGTEQRYVSPTTGICQKLVMQAVTPIGKHEVAISANTNQASKIALQLANPTIRWWIIFECLGLWLCLTLKLLLSFIWLLIQLFYPNDLADDTAEDMESYGTVYCKRYTRKFSHSSKEHSSCLIEEGEMDIPTHNLYPQLLIIHNPIQNEWVPCADHDIIIHTKFIAISFYSSDAYDKFDPDPEAKKAQFIEEKYDVYWLDLECVAKTQPEKNRDVYCMADVYRGAEMTLIMLGKSVDGEKKCWRGWGEQVTPLSLFQLANLAYTNYSTEQAIINTYSGKDPLERLERLTLLKSAIWQRGSSALAPGVAPPPSKLDMIGETPVTDGAYKAEHVYALMGFFEHRIYPNRFEGDLHALVRLSMVNDNDRIVEWMVSMLPSTITKEMVCWYSDNDIYGAKLWDILPEIQVAWWKDFPEVMFVSPDLLKRTIISFVPYLLWPIIIAGLVGDITLVVIGVFLLIISPWLFVYSQSGRILDAQPWLIGVKGVISITEAEKHLYGATTKKHFPRMNFTLSRSQFSLAEQGTKRKGLPTQYGEAKKAESRPDVGHIYTLIDTCSSTMYYFRVERPPTEGGLGRFVLCSDIRKQHVTTQLYRDKTTCQSLSTRSTTFLVFVVDNV
ncbi:hypothetical protein F4604DRAFT_1892597 [Suillus subluteus]|nr:hypothetical protein F4604DRAFT_1892597 [Suillus subluteus]